MSIRVLLADDHTILREALRSMLEREPDLEVVGEATDGSQALRLVGELAPDVVLMDISMPGIGGIDASRQILAEHSRTKVIALSSHLDRQLVLQMLEAGASGYLAKSAGSAELLRAIRTVHGNNTYLCPEIASVVVGSALGRKPAEESRTEVLGRREREVIALLADGKTSPEIGNALHIATSTVDAHRRNIMRKLGLHSVAELTKYAVRHGLTSV